MIRWQLCHLILIVWIGLLPNEAACAAPGMQMRLTVGAPNPDPPWTRLLAPRFGNPSQVDVSAQPVTYLSDQGLATVRTISPAAPGDTTVVFQITKPNGSTLPPITAVVHNLPDGSHTVDSTDAFGTTSVSGDGWLTTFTATITIFGYAPVDLGQSTFSETINGNPVANDPFLVRALALDSVTITPNPWDPGMGKATVKANVIGLPAAPDPAAWTPSPNVTWTVSLLNPNTLTAMLLFNGSGIPVNQTIANGQESAALPGTVPPLASAKYLPNGNYPWDITATDPVNRTDTEITTYAQINLSVKIKMEAATTDLQPTKEDLTSTPPSTLTLVDANFAGTPLIVAPSPAPSPAVTPPRTWNTVITVTATDCSDNPLPNQRLLLQFSVPGVADLVNNGGHNHFDVRPLGVVKILQTATGPVVAGGGPFLAMTGKELIDAPPAGGGGGGGSVIDIADHNVFKIVGKTSASAVDTQAITNSDGKFYLKFISSAYGGQVTFKVFPVDNLDAGMSLCPGTTNFMRLDVRVPDLTEIPDSSTGSYKKIGGTTLHPGPVDSGTPPPFANLDVNHYIKSSFQGAFTKFADDFFNQTNEQLVINDDSLPRGGLFDIAGHWVPPHAEHRIGNSMDIPWPSNRDAFNTKVQDAGWGVYTEADHAHVRLIKNVSQ